MRRHALVFILIPAVLVATVALAYFSYSSPGQREMILDTMMELAEEKVVGIEAEIIKAEQLLFEQVQVDRRYEVKQLLEATPFVSAMVLDDELKILPGGFYTKRASKDEAERFRMLFEAALLPQLGMRGARLNERGHYHGVLGGQDYLLSYTRRYSGGKIYYLVLEVDLSYLVGIVFPQFFAVRAPRLYQVVDDQGLIVFGHPFAGIPENYVISLGFPETLSLWRLRVAQRDTAALVALEKRKVIEFVLIAASLLVIVFGVIFLLVAVGREKRLSRLKSDFISNVSHELKTPLSIISMFGEMLAMGRVKSEEQATEYAEAIHRESVRLARLIDNVLDFAKIERGVDLYEFTECDLGEIVERAVEIAKHRLARADMTVAIDVEEGLPLLRLDGNAMTLATLNLVDNAIKYAKDGKQLSIAVARRGKRVEMSVRDWGPGIDAEEQQQVFERFYRAKSVRLMPIRGSGIGLALVKQIALAHRGDIDVSAAEGGGTVFRLWIPITSDVRIG